MEPALMVIGLNHRTAPVAMRERFWISESRRYDTLRQLAQADGIDEAVVLVTCNRTEFLLWSNEPTQAASSVLQYLGSLHGLKLSEWEHFYRLLDDAALTHIFRVTSSLDSMVVGEPQIVAQVKAAWEQARAVGATGRFLDAVLQKSLTVSRRVRNETAIGSLAVSIPTAAVELARTIFGSLEGREILLLGAGKMSELSARYLRNSGAASIRIINRTREHAQELAQKLGGIAVAMEDRWQHLLQADIVISSTACPHVVLSRQEAEIIAKERQKAPLLILDIAMPRDIDPAVRGVKGILLRDLDDLERGVQSNTAERRAAAAEAEKIVADEARGFHRKLQAESIVPTIVALRQHLDELCRHELESFRVERGPFSPEQNHVLQALASQITQKIATSLARELKGLPEKVEQERLTEAVQRLFHLQTLPARIATNVRNAADPPTGSAVTH
ncbi:MAG TPA: glutamyl-tRNA reductase [Candidatus Aquilonibacter sp.]|nr:glutamyl-tRNA reductase [Candidatus Aquilonibacter sp.]